MEVWPALFGHVATAGLKVTSAGLKVTEPMDYSLSKWLLFEVFSTAKMPPYAKTHQTGRIQALQFKSNTLVSIDS